MNKLINGFNEASPRTQTDKLNDYLMNEFTTKKIIPARIFAMADT